MGPNGSGKSTLLKILAGLEEPSSGTRAARKRLRTGYVPQDPAFEAGATVASVLRGAVRDLHFNEHEAEGRIAVAMGKAGFADGAQESLRNRVRGELDWLSRKARARTRKAQARLDEAQRLQNELANLDSRSKSSALGLDFSATERLVVAEGLTKSYGDREIVRGLDLVPSPGTRLGLLGSNGTGKSTLLRLLTRQEAPDEGTVEHAPGLEVVMLDQHRSRLDPEVSLKRTLAPHGDSLVFQGRSLHVAGWASFLFRSEQLDTPVRRLSGGEQARAVLARLMLEPPDLLLLDEPTNDLDIPTLEALEESLLEFPGALVLVTHDRYLLDRVSTRILAFDGRGGAVPYADYDQWQQGRSRAAARSRPATPTPDALGGRPRKLGYLEQREWDEMEARILEAETRLEACHQAVADPAVAADHVAVQARLGGLALAQAEVDRLYARWAQLEARVKP